MPGFLENFRQNIISLAYPESGEISGEASGFGDTVDNLIALGVLLWVVAQSDEKFLPEEKEKIGDILSSYGKISAKDLPIVLRAVEEASINRIDLYAFTREISGNLSFKAKTGIVENLFRVACTDRELDPKEHETIRKISRLLSLDHKGFIEAKIKIKKEFGLDTAGL